MTYLTKIKCDRCGGIADFLHTNSGNCEKCGDDLCQECIGEWHTHPLEGEICEQCYKSLEETETL